MAAMRKLAITLTIASILALGSPSIIKASNIYEKPPAVVFIQDKDDGMLLNHNFKYDNGMLVNRNSNVDESFWVKVH